MIMALVFVPFTYGTIMPIFFPLALFGLFNMYFVERLMVYYSYVRPPLLNDQLTLNTVRGLYMAPPVLLFVGALAFSNQQVFFNDVIPLHPEYLFPVTNLTFIDVLTRLTPGTILIYTFFLFFILALFRRFAGMDLFERFFPARMTIGLRRLRQMKKRSFRPYSLILKEW
jgi:hypothetical protein